MDSPQEVLRIARLLEAVFRVAKIPLRDFEQRIGMGSGSLTRIFNGEIDLKFRHVFAVLDGLAVSHEEFFRLVYKDKDKPGRSEAIAQDLISLLGDQQPARINPLTGVEKRSDVVLSDEELDRRIVKALRDHGILAPEKPRKPRKKKPRDKDPDPDQESG